MTDKQCQILYNDARIAGLEAVKKAEQENKIAAMVVNDGSTRYFVPDGPCGFAWVKVTPGNCKFANWLKTHGYVCGKSYTGGVDIWVGDFNQSMQKKEIYAGAFANVLYNAGIKAYADSRMD